MPLRYALLGLLIEQPGYEQDLEQRFNGRVGAWGLETGAVAAAMAELRQAGLVAPVAARAHVPKGAGRVVYRPTPRGIEAFDAWIDQPSPQAQLRDELQLKVAVSRPDDVARLVELTHEQEADCLARLQAIGPRPAFADLVARDGAWDAATEILMRHAETLQIQATMEWLGRVREALLWASRHTDDAGGVAER